MAVKKNAKRAAPATREGRPGKKQAPNVAAPAEVEGATRDAAKGNEEALTELAKW